MQQGVCVVPPRCGHQGDPRNDVGQVVATAIGTGARRSSMCRQHSGIVDGWDGRVVFCSEDCRLRHEFELFAWELGIRN